MSRRYRWALLNQILQFGVLLFMFSHLAGSNLGGGANRETTRYLPFFLTGLCFQIFYEAIATGAGARLNELKMMGLLQSVLCAPYPRWMILLAAGGASAFFGAARALIILFIGVWFFGISFEAMTGMSWVNAAASVLLTLVLAELLSLLNVSSFLIIPRLNFSSIFNSLFFGLLAGVYVPIDKFPLPLKILAAVNPVRWALEVFRGSFGLSETPLLQAWAAAGLSLCLVSVIVFVVYRRADRALVRDNLYYLF